ncbi:MAG: hypothetical protein V8T51_02255 [Senegalimassilia faecalis]
MCGWRAAKAATAARTSHPSKGLAAGDPAKMAGSHHRVRGHRAGAAKAFHEKMFPGYVSDFLRTDPEFIERFDTFAFDEVVAQANLDDETRYLG